ncbi:hypothetical protein FRC03_002431 [Tulasnella sp. 419]|nr:hypothetical protein FRC03_002431 [Tulasnella sp. 419]
MLSAENPYMAMDATPLISTNSLERATSENDQGDFAKMEPKQHPVYYKEPRVVLMAEDKLFYFDKAILRRFDIFNDMYEAATAHNHDATEGSSKTNPISLQGVTAFQLESLEHVLRGRWFKPTPSVSLEQWKAILHLATMWEYKVLRDYAIAKIERFKLPPKDMIPLAASCRVEKWFKPAYIELCTQNDPLTAEDAELLGIALFAILCKIREVSTISSGGGGRVNCRSCSRCISCSAYSGNSCNCANSNTRSKNKDTVTTSVNDIPAGLLWPAVPDNKSKLPKYKRASKGKPWRTVQKIEPVQPIEELAPVDDCQDPDPQVILRVDEVLYRVETSELCQFRVLREKLDGADEKGNAVEGTSDDHPLVLDGVTPFEFESVLLLLDARWFLSDPKIDLEQWKAVLHLSTLWDFSEIRELSIRRIVALKPSPMDSILLARKCEVQQWFKPAYVSLCTRAEHLTADEGFLLGLSLFADLTRIRETNRNMSKCYRGCSNTLYCNSCGSYQNNNNNNNNQANVSVESAVDALLAASETK